MGKNMCGRSAVANCCLTLHDFRTDSFYLYAPFDIASLLCLKLSSIGIEPTLCLGRPGSLPCFITAGNVFMPLLILLLFCVWNLAHSVLSLIYALEDLEIFNVLLLQEMFLWTNAASTVVASKFRAPAVLVLLTAW